MNDARYLVAAILVMAAVTVLLRALPFVALRRVADAPLLVYAGALMPAGIMVILVAYSVSGIDLTRPPYGVPSGAGILVTLAVHHWRRNPLLSILAGTGTYMLLLHLLS